MKKDSSELLLEWSEKIKDQKLSNKSAKSWCKENGISHNNFQYWLSKIRKKNLLITDQPLFLEIPEENPMIEISSQGIKLAIAKNFDRKALGWILNLLKAE